MEYLRNSTDENFACGQGQVDGQGELEDSAWLHRCKMLGISYSFHFLHFLGLSPKLFKALILKPISVPEKKILPCAVLIAGISYATAAVTLYFE